MGPKTGSWWLESKTDPRWNTHGEGTVGMFYQPEAVEKWIEVCKKAYGEPPADLEYGYMKH